MVETKMDKAKPLLEAHNPLVYCTFQPVTIPDNRANQEEP